MNISNSLCYTQLIHMKKYLIPFLAILAISTNGCQFKKNRIASHTLPQRGYVQDYTISEEYFDKIWKGGFSPVGLITLKCHHIKYGNIVYFITTNYEVKYFPLKIYMDDKESIFNNPVAIDVLFTSKGRLYVNENNWLRHYNRNISTDEVVKLTDSFVNLNEGKRDKYCKKYY